MEIVRPRLTDHFGIPTTQNECSFAIPFLEEDIPLYLDPFLLWKSPSQQDTSLHIMLISVFNKLCSSAFTGHHDHVIDILVDMSECREAGLGSGLTKRGLRISREKAEEIVSLFKNIPQVKNNGFAHIETIQLLVSDISKDRISDFACNLLKSFLIDFTQDECKNYGIPMQSVSGLLVFDVQTMQFKAVTVDLPFNPVNNDPIILIPKRWLRYSPWINYDTYFEKAYVKQDDDLLNEKVHVLNYNRSNYDVIEVFVSQRERQQNDCKNDPLFTQIPVVSSKKYIRAIESLPTGKEGNADKKYEDYCAKLMASMLYPHLDFAAVQSRTDSGSQIRDLVFYNNCSYPFLEQIYKEYQSKQIVFEMKNVNELDRDHINQLNRYLSEQFGKFGIILTRHPPKKTIMQNTIDLWGGQRRCILCIHDEDLRLMANVYESKQRDPIEVINKKYVEFLRLCPS